MPTARRKATLREKPAGGFLSGIAQLVLKFIILAVVYSPNSLVTNCPFSVERWSTCNLPWIPNHAIVAH